MKPFISRSRSRWHRATFDASGEFTVRRRITIGHREFKPGDPFDKSLCSPRRLRQLHEHKIIIASVGDAAPRPRKAEATLRHAPPAPGATGKPASGRKPSGKATTRRGSTTATGGGSTAPQPEKIEGVEIPEGWSRWPAAEKRALAESITGLNVTSGAAATTIIREEIARRGAS